HGAQFEHDLSPDSPEWALSADPRRYARTALCRIARHSRGIVLVRKSARCSRLSGVPATLRTIELHLLPYTDADSQRLPYLGAALSVARFLDLFLHAGTFVRIIWLEPARKGGPG